MYSYLTLTPILSIIYIIQIYTCTYIQVLDAISSIQTYSYKTNTGYAGKAKGVEGDLADALVYTYMQYYVIILYSVFITYIILCSAYYI